MIKIFETIVIGAIALIVVIGGLYCFFEFIINGTSGVIGWLGAIYATILAGGMAWVVGYVIRTNV